MEELEYRIEFKREEDGIEKSRLRRND